MTYTREMIIKMLSEKTDYYMKDVKTLLSAYDELVRECFDNITDDEDVTINLLEGIKINGHVVPERVRQDPRNGEEITVKATVKPQAKFSITFRNAIQDQYENSK